MALIWPTPCCAHFIKAQVFERSQLVKPGYWCVGDFMLSSCVETVGANAGATVVLLVQPVVRVKEDGCCFCYILTRDVLLLENLCYCMLLCCVRQQFGLMYAYLERTGARGEHDALLLSCYAGQQQG